MTEGTQGTDQQGAPAGTDAPLPATYNFADLWESIWPRCRRSRGPGVRAPAPHLRELAERANRLAHHLRAAGVGPGDRVGLFLRNDSAYLEAMIAAFSLRAVPVNMNHRYTGEELGYLLDDSGRRWPCWCTRPSPVRSPRSPAVAGMKALLVVDDPPPSTVEGGEADLPGAVAYEDALAARRPSRWSRRGRTGDDTLPDVHRRHHRPTQGRGVAPGGCLLRLHRRRRPHAPGGPVDARPAVDRMVPAFSYLPLAPLMHAAAQWTTWSWLLAGGKTVLMPGRSIPRRSGTRSTSTRSTRSPSSATPWAVRWSRRGRPTPTAGTCRPVRHLQRRQPDVAVAQVPPGRAVRGPGDHRRLRLVGERRAGLAAADRRATRSLRAGPLRPGPDHRRVRRRPPAGRPRLRRHRPGGQRRPPAARLPQRPREDRRPRSWRSTASATASPATWPRSRPTAPSSSSGAARSASTPAARRCSPRRSSRQLVDHPKVPTCWSSASPTSAGGARSPPWSRRPTRPSRPRSTSCVTTCAARSPATSSPSTW
jgi:hypothetical protein